MNNISDRLRQERERLCYSQADFGALGGVKKLAQLNYEKGNRVPDANYLEALEKVGLDVGYVITGIRQSSSLKRYFKQNLINALKIEPNGGPMTDSLTTSITLLQEVYLRREMELNDLEILMLNMSDEEFARAKDMIVMIYRASLVKTPT